MDKLTEKYFTKNLLFWHLNTNTRNDTQQNFNDGTYKCIVATIAFGMGINIPNVRLVIHYSCPKNI